MKYICNICNYETSDKSNFIKHNNTKKHVHNAQIVNTNKITEISEHKSEQFLCNKCDKTFTTKTSMYRHKREYCEYNKNESSEDKSILKETIDKLEKQNQTLMDIVQSQSKSVENNSETIKKSMNVLSFVTKQYPNAPPIEELEYDKFNKMTKFLMYDNKNKKKTNYSLEQIILFYFERNNLPEILGKAIVKEYKKDNPEDQSMWASDVSRLTFIVKSAMGKTKSKKSKWISDKNGVHFAELIIKPMFEIIKDKMKEYIKNGRLEDSEIRDEGIEDITVRLGQMQSAGELIRLINLNKYDGKVLKYVAPYFNLSIDSESDSEESEDEKPMAKKSK